jgi:hypothetical protein
MKESGIDWIGQIPEEWEVRPIKNIVETPVTDGPHETPMLYETGIPFLSAEAVKDGILDFNYKRGYISLRDHERFKKKVSPKKDDIFIVKSGATTGNVGIVNTDEIFDIWSPLALVRSKNTLAIQKYIYFYLLSTLFKAQVEFNWSFGTQQNIGMGVIERIKVILPPISEQERIVEILDKKTAQLDKAKALLEEQIQKLRDYRASLIYEIVTKGLDKNVPMKDSGIDWIGQVPEGWGVIKFKYLGDVKQGLTYSPSDIVDKDEGILVLRSGNIQNGILDFNNNVYVKTKVAESIVLRKNDILITARNGSPVLIGKNAIIDTDIKATFGAFMMVFRANKSLFAKFAFYLMNVSFNFYRTFFTTSTVNQLTAAIFNGIEVPLPSIYEQKKITDFLDQKTVQIDKLIQIKNQQIENINKQRQTLIYDYVTGKRRV